MIGDSGIPWLDRIGDDAAAAGAARRRERAAQASESERDRLRRELEGELMCFTDPEGELKARLAAHSSESAEDEVTGLDLYREHHGDGYGEQSSESPHRDQWEPGDVALFEYHCHEGFDSIDAPAWLRSHQSVTIVCEEESDAPPDSTFAERGEDGMPKVYLVEFADGVEWCAWEDELLTRASAFERPAPPST